MSQEKKMIKLGLFIVMGTILFITGLYYASNMKYLFSGTFKLSGVFKNASGLVVGNNVTLAGINVGTVDRIKFINDTAVQVDFIIEKEIRKYIKKDAVAFIGSEGLMGDKSIYIKPGSNAAPVVENGDHLVTLQPLDKDKLMKTLNGASEQVEGITADVNTIIGNVKNGKGTLGMILTDSLFASYLLQTIVSVNQSTQELNKLISITSSNIQKAGNNLNTTANNLNQISTLTKDSILNNLIATSKNAADITEKMSVTLTAINSNNGALGKLIGDTALAGDLQSTITNLKQGSDEFTQVMKATKGSFLFRGYFKKQNKEQQDQEPDKLVLQEQINK